MTKLVDGLLRAALRFEGVEVTIASPEITSAAVDPGRLRQIFSALMTRPRFGVPAFALDASTDWDDLENALEASAQYQSDHLHRIMPLFAFVPMTEPADPDAWVPFIGPLENLLLVSIERRADARLLRACERARDTVGPVLRADSALNVRANMACRWRMFTVRCRKQT